jgi:hypothetical protein
MKLAKLAILAATAAFAAMAFIGASSASAVSHPVFQLCKAQELLLCAPTNLIKHPLKGRILALPGLGSFKGLFTIMCKEGMGDSNEFEFFAEKSPLTKELVELNFTGCEGGCTKVEVSKNQPISVSMTAEGEAGEWFLETTGAKVKFTGCTFGATCTFKGNLKLKLQMDAEGQFFDVGKENQSFSFVEGLKSFCGETGTWNEGITRLDWRLDDLVKQPDGTLGTLDKAWLTLLEKLTLAS